MLNWPLILNPLNWLTVLLMVFIAGYAVTLIANQPKIVNL